MKYKNITEEKRATIRFAIFDGVANGFSRGPEQIVECVMDSILSNDVTWAFQRETTDPAQREGGSDG